MKSLKRKKYYSLIVVVFVLVILGGYFFYRNSSFFFSNLPKISWDETITLLKECKVAEVMQGHRRDYVKLTDQTLYILIDAPDSQNIYKEIKSASERCGFGIGIGIE